MSNRKIVAVEIGSSKIKGAVGEVAPDGTLTVTHIEEERQSPNYVRYGQVQNPKEVANVLNRIILKLNNRVSPAKVSAVYVGVGGRSLMSTQRRIDVPLSADTEITPEIVEELIGRAGEVVGSEREVVDVAPGEFKVDNMEVANPVGTIGNFISANVGVITCRQQMLRNLSLAITEKLGLRINGHVVRHMAMAGLVLSPDDRQRGVMLVDFGAETTTVSIYKGGFLRSLETVPLGSRHITRDIMACNYAEERAEELKRRLGNARPSASDAGQFRLQGIDDNEINAYVAARAGEIAYNILERLNESGLTPKEIPAGIVLTGGGSRLAGFDELLSEVVSGIDVRQAAVPAHVRRGTSKIQLADHIEVVALLHTLASQATKPCLEEPELQTDSHNDTAAAASAESAPDYEEEEVGSGKGFSPLRGISSWIKNLVNPVDDDDSEENFD